MLDQPLPPPLLDVRGVTLQYKTRDHLVTATYRVDFQSSARTVSSCWARPVAASRRC